MKKTSHKRPWVIKAGGELLVAGPARTQILKDLSRWHKKHPIVFVHGGGPQIEQELLKNNVPTQFINGRRVTSVEAMVFVERILSGQINKGLAAELTTRGAAAVGLSCRDAATIAAKPIAELGRAATPAKIKTMLIETLLAANFLPVLSSVGSDKEGEAVNINADDVASALAIQLRAANLIFLTNISGVLDQNKKRIPVLKTGDIDRLIKTGVITGGMIPKVQSARAAIQKGVGEVDILNGKEPIRLDGGTRIIK
jgi:acetylglutamate kinase